MKSIKHTFVETEYTLTPSKRKNGRSVYVATQVLQDDVLIPINVKYGFEHKLYYIRQSQIDYFLLNKTEVRAYYRLYNADGERAYGIWQHGRYGSKPHRETIELDKDKQLITRLAYASGQIKDQHKYLKAIL